MALFTRIHGWSPEEVHVLLAQIRTEWNKRKIHGWQKGYIPTPELHVRCLRKADVEKDTDNGAEASDTAANDLSSARTTFRPRCFGIRVHHTLAIVYERFGMPVMRSTRETSQR